MDRWNPIRQGASDVLVVPRSALLPNDPASVDCLIEDALGHPEGRAAFAAWLGVSEDQLEQPEVRAAARRLLTQGHWQAIEVGRTEPPRGSVFDVPVPVPTGPALPRKKKEVVEALSWVSIELLDHRGLPFAGFELTLEHSDGRRDRVVLDAAGRHTALAVKPPGPTRVLFPARVELPAAARGGLAMDGFAKSPADIGVAREPTGSLALNTLDRHYRFIVDAPAHEPTISFPSTLFATESAFPTHAIADLVTRAQETTDRDPAARLGIFGHTDTRDDADANKQLADRRSQSAYAILTGDWPLFLAVMQDEQWTLENYQAMLRVLGCNPTAIDGELGAQTDLAVASFRRAYNKNNWHNEGRARAWGDLPEGDSLDDPTKQAIVDAYHAELSGKLDPARFLGPKFAGCGEFNPLTEDHADNRRITLAIYGGDAPSASEFPCQLGDAGACQVDKGGQFTCKFYRERIHDEKVEHELTAFWDFDWMKTLTGKAHLSALTHLPDSNDVAFVVGVVEGGGQPDDDAGTGTSAPSPGQVIAKLSGIIRAGVAYALWDHGPGYDPFDQRRWFAPPSDDPASPLWLAPYLPPVFSICSGSHWGFSGGPGVALSRIHDDAQPIGAALAVSATGRILLVRGPEGSAEARAVHATAMHVPGFFATRGSAEETDG